MFAADSKKGDEKRQQEEKMEKLYSQIGQQKVEIDWLLKKKKYCETFEGEKRND